MSHEQQQNGWTAVPVSGKEIIEAHGPIEIPHPYTVKEIPFPSDDAIVVQAQSFVRHKLSTEAYNHSMRVFYWGTRLSLFSQYTEGQELISAHRHCYSTAAVSQRCTYIEQCHMGSYLLVPRHRHC